MKGFNRLVGEFFFNTSAIKFREEGLLFPEVQKAAPGEALNSLLAESLVVGFPFYTPHFSVESLQIELLTGNLVNPDTGRLTPGRIKLLFNHLPADITFFGEKLVYFPSLKKRIFTRSKR